MGTYSYTKKDMPKGAEWATKTAAIMSRGDNATVSVDRVFLRKNGAEWLATGDTAKLFDADMIGTGKDRDRAISDLLSSMIDAKNGPLADDTDDSAPVDDNADKAAFDEMLMGVLFAPDEVAEIPAESEDSPTAPEAAELPAPEVSAPAERVEVSGTRRKARRKASKAVKVEPVAEESAPPVDTEAIARYAAKTIMRAYRQSSAQGDAARARQIDKAEALAKIDRLTMEVVESTFEVDDPRVRSLADQAVSLMERHAALIIGERHRMTPNQAGRLRKNMNKYATRLGVNAA